jgi:hypothetical protein
MEKETSYRNKLAKDLKQEPKKDLRRQMLEHAKKEHGYQMYSEKEQQIMEHTYNKLDEKGREKLFAMADEMIASYMKSSFPSDLKPILHDEGYKYSMGSLVDKDGKRLDEQESKRVEHELYEQAERIATEEAKKALSDSNNDQELNFEITSHQGGGYSISKISLGDLRTQLAKFLAVRDRDRFCPVIKFQDGSSESFDSNDYYDIRIVDEETKKREVETSLIRKKIQELKELGVPESVFCEMDDYAPMPSIKFTPEQIVEFAKIIEKYLTDKKSSN